MGVQVKEYSASWEEHKCLNYHKTIREVLEKNPDADAIFCNGDALALQTIQTCYKMGIDIPEKSALFLIIPLIPLFFKWKTIIY